MDSALYNQDILRLATALVAGHQLDDPDGTAEVRSPLCGSRIQADIATDAEGKLQRLALRANACALGQASAAILVNNAVGLGFCGIREVRNAVASALKREGAMPSCWPELALLTAACDYPSRHAAILLPYDAILAAAKQANKET
jgi:NifU-like protein involved in Fe-S cluster formation